MPNDSILIRMQEMGEADLTASNLESVLDSPPRYWVAAAFLAPF